MDTSILFVETGFQRGKDQMPLQRLAELHQAGQAAAYERLEDSPSRWQSAQIDAQMARRYAREAGVALDRAKYDEELAAFLEGYNAKAQEYEQYLADQQSVLNSVTIASEFAHRHNLDTKTFVQLCAQKQIPGAERKQGSWIITEEAGRRGLEAYR